MRNTAGLLKGSTPKWRHLPTVAIRLPQEFASQLIEIARSLDEGKPIGLPQQLDDASLLEQLPELSLEQLLEIGDRLPALIARKKEEISDRRLEQGLIYLASRCDGALEKDGQGFSASDSRFGKWLAEKAKREQPIPKIYAEAALKMLLKYQKQLEQGGLSLPRWEAIAGQYPDVVSGSGAKPEKRIELIGDAIAVFAPYDSTGRFQAEAKTIKGYKFNGEDKSWRYPADKVEEVIGKFPEHEYHHDPELEGAIALAQQERLRLEAEALSKSGDIIKLVRSANLDAPLPNGWQLRDYQKRGVEWLLAHRKGGIYNGGILADQMGLGKTLTALMAAKAMQCEHGCAVFAIAPVSLLGNWQREAERAEVKIECFSWAKVPTPVEGSKFVLIADEAHFAQNFDSQRTKKLLALAHHENCLAAWLLTGTPIKNGRPINLYPLLSGVGHPLATNKREYERHYCNAGWRSVGKKNIWDTTGAAHLDDLAQKTEDAILRRTKQECLTELPAKSRLLKPVELESAQEKAYTEKIKALVASYRDRVRTGEVEQGAEALVTINYLRRVGSEFKVASAIALAEELLEQGQQVVIFTEFLESADALYARLGGELLTGASKDRQAMVDRFQSGESKVFIGTIKAGGVGITLTAASNVLLLDRPWTPGDAEQAEDRTHRIGQQNAVFSYWLQLGMIDEAIDNLLQTKQQRIELVLKGKRKTLRGLDSPQELAKQLLEIL